MNRIECQIHEKRLVAVIFPMIGKILNRLIGKTVSQIPLLFSDRRFVIKNLMMIDHAAFSFKKRSGPAKESVKMVKSLIDRAMAFGFSKVPFAQRITAVACLL